MPTNEIAWRGRSLPCPYFYGYRMADDTCRYPNVVVDDEMRRYKLDQRCNKNRIELPSGKGGKCYD